MKLQDVLNEVLDLKAITDTVNNITNQTKAILGQIPEIQKVQQDNIALVKKVEELTRGSMLNKQGTGTVMKTQNQPSKGGSIRATTPATGPATTPSVSATAPSAPPSTSGQ
jgi:hypothetical protein